MRPTSLAIPPSGPASVPVLAVDDNSVNRSLIENVLRRSPAISSYNIAESYEHAMSYLTRKQYHIVFLDIHLGHNYPRGGVSLARAIRQNSSPNRPAHVIAVTSDCSPDQVNSYREADFDGCLAKPFSPDALESLIRRLAQTDPKMAHPPFFFVERNMVVNSDPTLPVTADSPTSTISSSSFTSSRGPRSSMSSGHPPPPPHHHPSMRGRRDSLYSSTSSSVSTRPPISPDGPPFDDDYALDDEDFPPYHHHSRSRSSSRPPFPPPAPHPGGPGRPPGSDHYPPPHPPPPGASGGSGSGAGYYYSNSPNALNAPRPRPSRPVHDDRSRRTSLYTSNHQFDSQSSPPRPRSYSTSATPFMPPDAPVRPPYMRPR